MKYRAELFQGDKNTVGSLRILRDPNPLRPFSRLVSSPPCSTLIYDRDVSQYTVIIKLIFRELEKAKKRAQKAENPDAKKSKKK